MTEARLAGEKRIKPARSGARPTAPWLAHVRPAPRGSDPEVLADHVVTLGRAIEVEGRRYTIEKNTAADNCRLASFSRPGRVIESHPSRPGRPMGREARRVGIVATISGLTQKGASGAMASHDYKVGLDPKPGFNGFSLMIHLGAFSVEDAIRRARGRYPHHDVRAAPVRMN